MTPATTVRLALAGTATDTARVVLTAIAAGASTSLLLAVVTTLSAPAGPAAVSPLLVHAGPRPGVATVLVLLAALTLFLVAQGSRLGAPARDRRLAAYRLGGATPAQVAGVAATETGLAAALGAAVALVVYVAGRLLATGPLAGLPPWPALVVAVVAVPAVATALSLVLLRRVAASPYGIVRRLRERPVGPWPFVVVLGGVGLLYFGLPLLVLIVGLVAPAPSLNPLLVVVPLVTGIVTIGAGLALSAGWFASAGGRLLLRYGRGPVALLAGGRLVADPWAGSRVALALVPALFVGSIAIVVSAWYTTQGEVARRMYGEHTRLGGIQRPLAFGVGTAVLIGAASLLVLVTEQVTSGRRGLAALVATGTPRPVLLGALLLGTAVPLVPTTVLAAGLGGAAGWSGGMTRHAVTMTNCHDEVVHASCRTVSLPVAFPWADLAACTAVCVVAALAAVALGAVVLRASTRPAELRTE